MAASYTFIGPKWHGNDVTWAFASPDQGQVQGHPFTGAIQPQWEDAVRSALSHWAEVSGLTFDEVAAGGAGTAAPEILFGWGKFGATSTTIGMTEYSYLNQEFTAPVRVLLEDPSEHPLVMTGSAPVYSDTGSGLYSLALHELGHALGLGHSQDTMSIMYPTIVGAAKSFDASDITGIQSLYEPLASRLASLTDPGTGTIHYEPETTYSGPVLHVEFQYLGGSGKDIIGGTSHDDFINALGGDDAVDAGPGNDVIDGGGGSNFLVGGAGSDVFFLDGREGQQTWSTITDWQAGEQLSLWGWHPGLSKATWSDKDGLGEYSGVTLHADINGDGQIDTSVTWTGVTHAQLAAPVEQEGLLWFA